MFKCYILCALEIFVYKDFLKHLKKQHNLREDSEYKCMFPNCCRTYNSKNSFIKHLKNDHMNYENAENDDFYVNNESFGIGCLFVDVEDVLLDGFNLNGMNIFFTDGRLYNKLFVDFRHIRN